MDNGWYGHDWRPMGWASVGSLCFVRELCVLGVFNAADGFSSRDYRGQAEQSKQQTGDGKLIAILLTSVSKAYYDRSALLLHYKACLFWAFSFRGNGTVKGERRACVCVSQQKPVELCLAKLMQL